ncbi:MAG: condensation domain-containing protein, partial [Blastocatellia bacterium]
TTLGTISDSKPFGLITEEDRRNLPADIEDAYPLAMLQAGMLFHSLYRPDSPIYHNITSFHLRAPFDGEAMRTAIVQVVAAHPVLRTSFDFTNFSEPLQLVHKEVTVPFEIDDLSNLTPDEQKKAVACTIQREKKGRFDHTKAPLVRFHAHPQSEETFRFTVTEDHAILDGWSVARMIAEIFRRYFFQLGLVESTVENPPTPTFRDFVALERKVLEDEEHRKFWVETLKDAPILRLPRWQAPGDGGIADEQRVRTINIPAEVHSGLRRLAEGLDVPLRTVLLAAHLKVLSILGGGPVVSTGVVFNGRLEEEGGDNVLGLHLNTLPIGVKLSGGTWVDLIQEVFRAEIEMLPHRRFPLAVLQVQSDMQQLFETIFNFIHFHAYRDLLELQGIELLEEMSLQETNFTLATEWIIDVSDSELILRVGYDHAQLCDLQISYILGYYTD